MKILHLTAMWPQEECPASGTFVQSLVQGLNEAGVANDVLIIPARKSRLAYLAIIQQFLRMCRSGDYDIVHAQYAHAVLIASIQRSVPVVGHFHGEYDDVKDAFLASLASRIISFGIAVDQKGYNRAHCPHKVLVPIGVDSRKFRSLDQVCCRKQLKLDLNKKYVLFPADPDIPEKNYPLFIKSMELVRRRLPLAEPVILKEIRHDLVPIYMNAVDLMLLASHTEASPTVVKEALLCNLPVVSTDVGDVRRLLKDVEQCAVVPGDPQQMSAQVVAFLKLGRRSDGWKKEKDLNLMTTVESLLSFYRDVLALSRRRN